ncbi:myosin light chain kinase 2, skeletal/cardiac muscle [Apus apus]|uniref:myosin light chain kinase 2, skeletal/cardiac muscle n=1 Tax=Apus apus TaxID=8895 RepID=UPI0021F83315|nr:myosin light chain kinase 2, skeletal/cardiac muscle [Apus apus]
MEQGSGVGSMLGTGGAGGTSPPEAEGSAAPHAAAVEGTVPAATAAEDGGKDEPGQKKALTAGMAQDGGQAEPGKEKAEPVRMTALTAPEPQDGGKENAPAAGEPKGGKDEPVEVQDPAATEAQGGGKEESMEEKGPAVGEPEGEKAKSIMEGKGPAAAKAQDGGKDEPTKGKTPGGSKMESSGKAEPMEEKAPAAEEAEGQKAKPTKGTALAAAQAQDGGKEEPAKEKLTVPAKEKGPAAAKAQDGEKKAAKAEKTSADTKPAKEKAPAPVKAQDGGNKVAKAEKAPAAKKPQGRGKVEPATEKPAAPPKEKPAAPPKEKAPAVAKAQDGGKAVAKAEKTPAAKKPQDGSKGEPAKEKTSAPAMEKALAAAAVQDGGKKTAKAGNGGQEPTAAEAAQGEGEKAAKVEGTEEPQPPRGSEPPRPVLQLSLSCPAACQREEQPWEEVAVMEMIPEETAAAEPREGSAEPGPAPPALGDLPESPVPAETAGTSPERTLPRAGGQPPHPPGAAEQPGPGGQPSSGVAEPPPSPYLTPDFGKEDPFEILDDVPPPPAPFAHRIVTLRSDSVSSQFNLSSKEILGGGKFGEVHTCTEKQTGLKLAAKVIRKQGAKDKEMVLLEIDVMNQLNHRNLIQLYDAIETPREIILFMEFVEGGELFERIIDDDYQLTEVDCMVFVRQICEGIRFMHHMHVLHLDLKPENILCVAATGHMVKIIDFGLARRYNPQEKLKVNFGTPEFLSPEVVNYEQVSYSTDMWSMGVITYMLLSGLSPFLGDNDTETLNNVLAANWYFDEETFESVSEEAKDFVSNLIIKEKSARMSAGQCLQHPWLNNLAEKAKRCNRRLKSQVLLKKYVMRRRWKKNFIGVCAANRFKKITSSGSLTALGV